MRFNYYVLATNGSIYAFANEDGARRCIGHDGKLKIVPSLFLNSMFMRAFISIKDNYSGDPKILRIPIAGLGGCCHLIFQEKWFDEKYTPYNMPRGKERKRIWHQFCIEVGAIPPDPEKPTKATRTNGGNGNGSAHKPTWTTEADDAVSALRNLGYPAAASRECVSQVLGTLSEGATTENIILAALKLKEKG